MVILTCLLLTSDIRPGEGQARESVFRFFRRTMKRYRFEERMTAIGGAYYFDFSLPLTAPIPLPITVHHAIVLHKCQVFLLKIK